MRSVWTEQLCVILQMEHNTAFVDMMSCSGKITRAPPLDITLIWPNVCQLSVIMRVIEVKKRGSVTLSSLTRLRASPGYSILKSPYYRLWTAHILVLGVNRLICMQGQKTLSFSNNMHLFLPYLLNDSQTIHVSKALLCVTLIFSDWSISFKAAFLRF